MLIGKQLTATRLPTQIGNEKAMCKGKKVVEARGHRCLLKLFRLPHEENSLFSVRRVLRLSAGAFTVKLVFAENIHNHCVTLGFASVSNAGLHLLEVVGRSRDGFP